MTDVLGPADAGAVNTLTTTTDVSNPTAGDTWFQDCVANNPATGTNVVARWLNRLMQQSRRIIRLSGVPQSNSDDDMLGQAIQSGAMNWAGTFGGTADALTAMLSPAPMLLIQGMRLYGIASTPNATTSPTLNVGGLGLTPIIKHGGAAVAAGDVSGLMQFEYDGTSWRIFGIAPSDIAATQIGLQKIVNFATVGSHSYTWTPGARALIIEVQGSGGGGGATNNVPGSGNVSVGISGAGGAYAKKYILTSALTGPATVIVGIAGAGGVSAGAGGAGGTSSFACTGMTSVVCTGGAGGPNAGTFSTFPQGTTTAAGGSASGGDAPFNISGGCSQSAQIGSANQALVGVAGASHFGVSPIQFGIDASGAAGNGPGAGGTGGLCFGLNSGTSGGAGALGCVVITELF